MLEIFSGGCDPEVEGDNSPVVFRRWKTRNCDLLKNTVKKKEEAGVVPM
jgi:hypothetical protein